MLGCLDPCRCTTAVGIMRAVTRIECKGGLFSILSLIHSVWAIKMILKEAE